MRMLVMTSLAACGGAPVQPVGNKPVTPTARTVVQCPKDIDQLASTVWGKPSKDVDCTPLWIAGRAHWWVLSGEDDGGQSRALLATDRTTEWKQPAPKPDETSFVGKFARAARSADLDGDGNDEVVFEEQMGEGGASNRSLHVVTFPTLAAPQVAFGLTLEIQSGPSDPTEGEMCNVGWNPIKAGKRDDIEIETTCRGATRKTIFRWNGKELAEVK